MEFSKEYDLIPIGENNILQIYDKDAIKELLGIKEKIFNEIKNLNSFSKNILNLNDMKDLFKIAIRYHVEMLKLNNEEIKKDFDYLILGPEFLVSSTQPALGMVYKIMEMNNLPCMKFSEEKDKQSIPGSKSIYRLFDSDNNFIGDYLTLVSEKDDFIKEKKIIAL